MVKRVVSADMVAHLWANQSQEEARTAHGNLYFRGPTIFSYQDGFPLAVFSGFADAEGRRVVFRNGADASNTTRRHNSAVSQALRGHALRIVTVHGAHDNYAHYGAALSPRECHLLAAGNAAALVPIIARMANTARELIGGAMRRRSADRAAYGLRHAADILNDCDFLVTLGRNARERSKLARAIGDRPAIPDGFMISETVNAGESYEWTREAPAPDFWRIVEPLRIAALAAAARADAAGIAKRAADEWKNARNAKASARNRLDWCNDAARNAATVARICARGKIPIPRGVPVAKVARAYADKLRPRAALEWSADNARSANKATADLRQHFDEARRMRRGPNSADAWLPEREAQAVLQRVDNPATRATRAALAALAENGAMPESASYPPLFPVLVALAAHPGPFHGRAVSALRELRAALQSLDAAAGPIGRKLARRNARELLEESARNASADIFAAERVVFHGALPERGKNAAWLIQAASHAAARYATRYAETPPDLRHGLPESFDVAALEAARDRVDFETDKRDALREYEHAAAMLAEARALHGVYPHSVRDTIAKAAAAADAAIRADDRAARAAATLGETYEKTAAAVLRPEIATLRASVNARLAALTESERVALWRNGDDGARNAFLYRAAPRFRIRPGSGGSEIESTLGAIVSVAAGRLLWRRIRAAVRNGRGESFGYGTGPHIGPFRLSSIGADGSAIVGCHNISAQEARDFAAWMNWPPIDAADDSDADAA